jgi:hypothetical protein
MATTKLTFGEWMPDQPSVSGALTDAKNVVSQAIGYGPFPTPVTFSTSNAAEDLTSLYAAKQPNGDTALFAAGATKIYTVTGVGGITQVKTGMTTGANDRVRFTQFGKTVISTNNAEKLQAWTLGTSTSFADLSATAPIAKFITVVRDFVVCANTLETTQQQYRVRWSAINNETDWTEDVNTQSDYQDIPDGGQIVGIRGGEFGLVFLERAIHRMSYVGTPFIFQFDNISRGKGCMVAGSIAQYQGVSFFLSDDGFYMCDGQNVTTIGAEKVDRFFLQDASESDYKTMSAAVDPIRKLVIWNYKTVNGNRSVIIYNFKTQKWTYGDAGTDFLAEASTSSVTLEQLDSLSNSIDALTTSLDSQLFVGGKYFLGGTLATRVMTYTGASQTAVISTGDLDIGANSVVTLARPIVDNGSATVAIASRTLLNQGVSFNTAVAASSENRVSLRSAGRYHRLKVTPTGANWNNAISVDVDVTPQGVR